MISGHQQQQQQQQLALESPQSKKPRIVAPTPTRKQSVMESNDSATDYLDYENNSSWDTSASASDFQDFSNLDTSSNHDLHLHNVSSNSDELINNSKSIFESVFRDDLEKERSKNRGQSAAGRNKATKT